VGDVEALPADERVAATWARLRVHLAQSGRRLSVNDLWIAATAVAHELPPVTRDDDFAPVDGVAGLRVVHA
jgi:predicted nucleic acid-binding protein